MGERSMVGEWLAMYRDFVWLPNLYDFMKYWHSMIGCMGVRFFIFTTPLSMWACALAAVLTNVAVIAGIPCGIYWLTQHITVALH